MNTGTAPREAWLRSPFYYYLAAHDLDEFREPGWKTGENHERISPAARELRAARRNRLFCHRPAVLSRLNEGVATIRAMRRQRGCMVSWTSDRPGGFAEPKSFNSSASVMPLSGAGAEIFVQPSNGQRLCCSVYLGRDAGRKGCCQGRNPARLLAAKSMRVICYVRSQGVHPAWPSRSLGPALIEMLNDYFAHGGGHDPIAWWQYPQVHGGWGAHACSISGSIEDGRCTRRWQCGQASCAAKAAGAIMH